MKLYTFPISRSSAPAPAVYSSAGAAVVDITPKRRVAMAGYSFGGHIGKAGDDRLYARALYLDDGQGDQIAICYVDLWSGTAFLLSHVCKLLSDGPLGIDRVVIAGTHTHTGPGNYSGNGFYDGVAQPRLGFRPKVARRLARGIAKAIRAAYEGRRPARVAVKVERLWHHSRNRSMEAFLKSSSLADWKLRGMPGYGAPGDLSPQQQAIDPRLTVITAVADSGELIASFATFSCHGTSLGNTPREFARDWPGYAVDAVARRLGDAGHGDAVVALGQSATGDATALPPTDPGHTWDGPRPPVPDPDEEGRDSQGPALARFVGEGLAAKWAECTTNSIAHAKPFNVHATLHLWEPLKYGDAPAGQKIASWSVGCSLLAGAEDLRSLLPRWIAREGMTSDYYDKPGRDQRQWPKKPVGGVLQRGLQNLFGKFAPSSWHPLHVVRIAGHVFATVPGEPTACAASVIERAIDKALRHAGEPPTGVTVIGYAGDYAGYFTTPAEYAQQHYEGAHTLYGRESLGNLSARLVAAAQQLAAADAPLPRELHLVTVHRRHASGAWREDLGDDGAHNDDCGARREGDRIMLSILAPPGACLEPERLAGQISVCDAASGEELAVAQLDAIVSPVGPRPGGDARPIWLCALRLEDGGHEAACRLHIDLLAGQAPIEITVPASSWS